MSGGNFNPQALRFGASSGTNLEAILDELRQGMGTSFDVDRGSVTWVYLNALARVMNDVFEQNQRLANQWDPDRMTDFLERWEIILGIIPIPTDTLVERRRKVELKFQNFGQAATLQIVQDLLSAILTDDVFVQIIHNLSTNPETGVAIPGGAIIPGGATIPDGEWYSDVSYLPIKVTQPSYMDDLTFYQTVGQIFSFLDTLMPAWVTYDWFRQASDGSNTFILDDERNLDNELLS